MYVMMGQRAFSALFGTAALLVATWAGAADLTTNGLDRATAAGLARPGAPTRSPGSTTVDPLHRRDIRGGWGHQPSPPCDLGVPELDPESATGALALLGGVLLIATGRRRRKTQK